ncbi:MAG TPA: hypothetical protein VFH73_03965 [Polyangia bacterium]|nr:hypothetical protein [Polyangia bacterium]
MVYPALGMMAGIWLITSAFMRLEPGARVDVALAVGCAALLLSPVSYWSPLARRSLVGLGIILGLANILLSGPIHAEASWAGPVVLLLVAGASPKTVTVAAA